ncbi:hypothetical protein I4I73_06010 [Pseudonocardia sp. KRD-184]|uniref:ROK family protein n=1 Tax=Pseudonocardia oceani TaxID=2792013 RepID=A0ABS6U8V6_9PSEU|nr:hypothetical protein [Pseudonocardia oceani]MBW0088675.1 hypothetical protein [Pseudonocardia oceani]MBW0095552.1 hypothetical protein [Pseudonocardia oceani]MBW0108210.1 hypothetical protein [Pseudonocardia oceani]MBW0120653.1 hypothetical protein [Pseudonocardia oceani]MBW0128413.1 hypothetical protein [Pseudonocardia oceani]
MSTDAAVCGVLAAAVALADPTLVVLGGTWGSEPAVLDAVAAAFAQLPRHVPVRPAQLADAPSLTGARAHALHELRTVITTAAPGRAAPLGRVTPGRRTDDR